MLTKQEITKKKSLDFEDSDETREDKILKKLQKKRFYIVLAILLTIGISLLFIIYRQTKELFSKPISIPRVPQINLPKSTPYTESLESLTGTISNIITVDPQKWNIVVASDRDIYNWPDNKSHFNRSQSDILVRELSALSLSHLLDDLLPQGLDIKEKSQSLPAIQKLSVLITPPGKTLLFDFEYQGSAKDFQTIITKLIPSIYWETINPSY